MDIDGKQNAPGIQYTGGILQLEQSVAYAATGSSIMRVRRR